MVQTLSCVGFVETPAAIHVQIREQATQIQDDYTREQDTDNDPSNYDEITGCFINRPTKPSLKVAANRAVQRALDSTTKAALRE